MYAAVMHETAFISSLELDITFAVAKVGNRRLESNKKVTKYNSKREKKGIKSQVKKSDSETSELKIKVSTTVKINQIIIKGRCKINRTKENSNNSPLQHTEANWKR